MRVIEFIFQLTIVAIAMTCAYFSTTKLFNMNMDLVDLALGLLTYGTYLFTGATVADAVGDWFKKVHWDKIEELKKVNEK